jgi:hypothetical protein
MNYMIYVISKIYNYDNKAHRRWVRAGRADGQWPCGCRTRTTSFGGNTLLRPRAALRRQSPPPVGPRGTRGRPMAARVQNKDNVLGGNTPLRPKSLPRAAKAGAHGPRALTMNPRGHPRGSPLERAAIATSTPRPTRPGAHGRRHKDNSIQTYKARRPRGRRHTTATTTRSHNHPEAEQQRLITFSQTYFYAPKSAVATRKYNSSTHAHIR